MNGERFCILSDQYAKVRRTMAVQEPRLAGILGDPQRPTGEDLTQTRLIHKGILVLLNLRKVEP